MNFQQLRYVREAVRQNLNLTEAASALYTSQSGVIKQIEDLVAYLSDQEGGAPRERSGVEPREALVRAASGQLRPLDLF